MLGMELTQEEQLLRESAARFVERDYAFSDRREAVNSELGFRQDVWAIFAELGWLGINVPASAGGSDGGARQTALVMEPLGRGLVIEPFLASAVTLLPGLVRGERRMSLAYTEPKSRYDINVVGTRAVRSDDGYVINGHKSVVLNGDSAHGFIVSARTSGEEADTEGISLLEVPADQEGVSIRGYATNDGGRGADVSFDNVTVGETALLGEEGEGFSTLEQSIDRAIAAVCAESLGVMSVLNDVTLEYAKTRQQFGQPIGKNQALQHRLVDMFVGLEETRSLLAIYMGDVDSSDANERARAASAMKIQVGKAGRLIGQETIQLHGGIAMTDEYIASHYFKRMTVIARLFGDVDWHLDRFAMLSAS